MAALLTCPGENSYMKSFIYSPLKIYADAEFIYADAELVAGSP